MGSKLTLFIARVLVVLIDHKVCTRYGCGLQSKQTKTLRSDRLVRPCSSQVNLYSPTAEDRLIGDTKGAHYKAPDDDARLYNEQQRGPRTCLSGRDNRR